MNVMKHDDFKIYADGTSKLYLLVRFYSTGIFTIEDTHGEHEIGTWEEKECQTKNKYFVTRKFLKYDIVSTYDSMNEMAEMVVWLALLDRTIEPCRWLK